MPIPVDPTGGTALIDYVGGTVDDAEFAERKYLEAHKLVSRLILNDDGTEYTDPVTGDLVSVVLDDVLPEQVLEVGAKLWDRRNAPGGEISYSLDGAPVRLAPLDPLVTVRPLLAPFLPGGFA